MTEQKVFFFHIPKCAGMSIWHQLWQIYGWRQVLQVGSVRQTEKFLAAPAERLARYAAIGGHGWLASYRAKLGELDGYLKITTLRDPVDRVISAYNYIRHNRWHHQHGLARQASFEEFAALEMTNMQTRLLTGEPDHHKAIELLNGWFDLYACSEHLTLIQDRLARIGRRPYRAARRRNVSKKAVVREAINPAFLNHLENINRADMNLFEHVAARAPHLAA